VKKAIIAIALAAAFLGGCSKSSDSGTSSDAASPAADAVTTSAASPDAGASAPAASTSAATAAAGEATVATAVATAPGTAATTGANAAPSANAAPGANAAIDLPVYPGATEQNDKGMSLTTGTASVKMQVFDSKDDAKKVIDWYKAHLPSGWQNFVISTDNKTMGTFTNDNENGSKPAGAEQSVIVTVDNGVTRIQLTTKKGS
jgi:hypothetical protein